MMILLYQVQDRVIVDIPTDGIVVLCPTRCKLEAHRASSIGSMCVCYNIAFKDYLEVLLE